MEELNGKEGVRKAEEGGGGGENEKTELCQVVLHLAKKVRIIHPSSLVVLEK
jgi:hypothetical protein